MRALILLCGCAGPFVAAGQSLRNSAVTASFCGSSKLSAERLLANAEPPSSLPTEVGGSGGLEPPEEARFCVRVENHGEKTARIDRSYLALKYRREKQPWIPDTDDQEVIVHAGEAKELHVGFHYSPMVAGEDVLILFDGAVKLNDRPIQVSAVAMRKN